MGERNEDGFTPRERDVFELRHLTQSEIAVRLGISRQSVSQTVKRLKERGLWQVPDA